MKKGTDHHKQLNRLKRIEGQVRGLRRMVEEKRYCMDIVVQIKAIRAALRSVEMKIVEEHIHGCVLKAVKSSSDKKKKEILDEIIEFLKMSLKD
ncbi:MAG: transcriptional regulator [Bdellovibrio sp.]|nr:MAG: transcriptional regulator [Bdellovibrio sp.]